MSWRPYKASHLAMFLMANRDASEMVRNTLDVRKFLTALSVIVYVVHYDKSHEFWIGIGRSS